MASSGTILFVDDEPALRSLGRAILQRFGYEVLLAGDGRAALDTFRRERDRIDLIVLDLTMPHLSGRDTFHELLAMDERVQVLFASGCSTEQLSSQEKRQSVGFVSKPYRPTELATVIRDTLARHPIERGNALTIANHSPPHPPEGQRG